MLHGGLALACIEPFAIVPVPVDAGEGIDAAAVATTVVSITGAAALLVAGTALFKYWDVRIPPA